MSAVRLIRADRLAATPYASTAPTEASTARLEPGMTGRVLSLGVLARARFDVLDVDHELPELPTPAVGRG